MYNLAQAQEPTKGETEAWLNGKFNDYYVFLVSTYSNGETISREYTTTFKIRNCACSFREVYNSSTKPYSTEESEFNFAKMTDVKVEESNNSKAYYLEIRSFNDERVVLVRRIYHQDGDKLEEVKENKIVIYFTDRVFAERAAKALQHYIKLCGGKKEKF
jgi:hypothetical protein